MCREIRSVWKHFIDLMQWYAYADMYPTGLILALLESWNIPMQRCREIHSNCLRTNIIYRMKTSFWNHFRLFIPHKAPDNIFLFSFPHAYLAKSYSTFQICITQPLFLCDSPQVLGLGFLTIWVSEHPVYAPVLITYQLWQNLLVSYSTRMIPPFLAELAYFSQCQCAQFRRGLRGISQLFKSFSFSTWYSLSKFCLH